MATFRDLLAAAKSEIREVDTETAAAHIAAGAIVLDVREPDEYEEGAIPGAIHIPRGHLEAQIENRIADKNAPVVVYCAGGVRSAFAAETLARARLHRRRIDGRWVRAVEGRGPRRGSSRRRSTPEQNNRYKRHLLLPEVGAAGQVKLLEAKVLMLGAGGLGSPAALYLAAAGVGTIGIVDMDEVDASNLQRQILHNIDRIGDRKVDSAKKTLTMLNPDVERGHLRHPPRRVEHHRHHLRLRRDRRRRRQLPDPLPAQRRQRQARHPGRARLDLPLRGHGQRVPPDRGPDVPRHGARAAARRARPELRRGRRARRAARHHRVDPGARDDQGHPRPRRAADRSHPDGRHDRHGVPGLQPASPTPPTKSPGPTATASRSWNSTVSAPPA